MNLTTRRLIVLLFSIAFLASACGGGSDDAGDESTTTTTSTDNAASSTTLATTTTEASGAVSGLEGVRQAVIRIEAAGAYAEPDASGAAVSVESGWSGSGFIIDESGLAVTNNHVVTGAAFIKVYLEGEDDPRNAKILGVSECSDLAVIDIDGDDLPYLDWFDDDIVAGTDVYAAGFPLGDPEYTITEGIISKEKAEGETSWASVDSVIQHTARILPGNSGGPLVTPDGQVVAINYAGITEYDINEAISRDEAMKILDDLIAGNDVNSIGINGSAFSDGQYSGIWVSAVESGSPADVLGIREGDIITKLEGLALATDGTKSDYCDILRTKGEHQPMSIEILRLDTEEVLTGTLNGDTGLELAFSFATQLEDDVVASDTQYEYMEVTDDTGTLVMQIPTTWVDVSGLPWVMDDEEIGISIAAAPDLAGFYGTWDTPGVFFGVSQALFATTNAGDILDTNDFSADCTFDDRYTYEDAVYTGAYNVWLNCGGTETAFVELEAYKEGADFLVNVQIQVVTDADLDALDTILATFDAVNM